MVGSDESAEPAQEQEEVQPQGEVQEELPVLEEVVEEQVEELVEEVEEAIAEAQETGEPLPENIQKLVDFMNETGGDLEDYVRLNQNFDDYDNTALLREYYKQTKPHLNSEEVDFLLKDSFFFDEEID